MAKEITNECCDCAVPAYPCQGDSCPLRHVIRYVCDRRGDQTTLYECDGEELCESCLIERFDIVEGSDEY